MLTLRYQTTSHQFQFSESIARFEACFRYQGPAWISRRKTNNTFVLLSLLYIHICWNPLNFYRSKECISLISHMMPFLFEAHERTAGSNQKTVLHIINKLKKKASSKEDCFFFNIVYFDSRQNRLFAKCNFNDRLNTGNILNCRLSFLFIQENPAAPLGHYCEKHDAL